MKENNNKGFTLIEILVAIIALALVVMPLLQGFVSTANLNKKSREKMMATNVAQSIMERYSTSTIEEIARDLDPDLDPSTPFEEDENHIYSYEITNYPHNGTNYDIKVSLDADAYYGDEETSFNSSGYAQITSIDTAKDAIYAESDRVLKDALDEFVNRNISASPDVDSYTREQFQNILKRTIKVVVEDKTEGTDTYTDVNVYYEYEAPSGWVDPGKEIYSKSLNIFTNQNVAVADREDIRNVYVLFRPYYEGVAENFVIENKANKKFNIYLIKLITCDEADLDMNERGYSVTVNLYEDEESSYNGSDFKANTKVFTNLGYNMAVEDEVSTVSDERLMPSQVNYVYWPNDTISLSGIILGDKVEKNYFVPEYTSERMYLMKVEVFPAGAAAANFPSEQKITELSN